MTFEQWQQANLVLQAALARPAKERSAFLETACGPDTELLTAVARLLQAQGADDTQAETADPEPLADGRPQPVSQLDETQDGPPDSWATAAFTTPLAAARLAETAPTQPVAPAPIEFVKLNAATNVASDSSANSAASATTNLPEDSTPLDRLGTYKLLGELGRGSMGQVYLAEDTRLGRRVAIKLLPRQMHTDHTRVRRFEQEARAASALNHPNIITIFEVGEAPAGRFLVMELVEGLTLRALLHSNYAVEDVLAWGAQLAKALSAAHSVGIIHRDIKPENIMVREDGYVKVLDFGLARLVDAANGNLDQFGTTPGALIGTIRYMSPEQVRGEKADAPSDIFALGVMLYELLARQHPFAGSTIYEIMQAITTFTPPPLTNYLSDLPAEIATLVRRMIDKNIQRRPTATEVATTLSAGLSSSSGHKRSFLVEPLRAPTADFRAPSNPDEAQTPAYTTQFDLPSPYDTLVEQPPPTPSHSSGSGVKTLAVLPFTQAGQNEEVEYLCDGIAESLINNLAALPNLRVLARSTVFRFKGSQLDPLAAGRELGVQAVLTGRIVQHTGKVIVKVELVNINEGTQVWGENYLRPLTDVFALETEIAQAISAQLRLKLSGEQQERLAKHHTENADAYQAYLRGRHFWNRRNEEGLQRAIEAFNQAITLDASYALAYAGLADTYLVAGANGLWPSADTLPKARAYASAALELDPGLAAAHATLGSLHGCYEFNWPAAEQSLKRALELNPGYATAHFWHATFFLLCWGRFDEALAAIERALQLDPLSIIINTTRGYALLLARRYEEALAQLRKAYDLEPSFYGSLEYMALIYEETGQYPAALDLQQQLLTNFYHDTANAHALRAAYESSGVPGYWRKRLEIVQAQAQTRYVYPHRFAELYMRLGDAQQALNWLERACDERSARVIWLGVNPLFEDLHHEPRFIALLRRLKLQ